MSYKNSRKYRSKYRFGKCYKSSSSIKYGIVFSVNLRYFYTWKVCWKDKAIAWIIQSKKYFVGGRDPDR